MMKPKPKPSRRFDPLGGGQAFFLDGLGHWSLVVQYSTVGMRTNIIIVATNMRDGQTQDDLRMYM